MEAPSGNSGLTAHLPCLEEASPDNFCALYVYIMLLVTIYPFYYRCYHVQIATKNHPSPFLAALVVEPLWWYQHHLCNRKRFQDPAKEIEMSWRLKSYPGAHHANIKFIFKDEVTVVPYSFCDQHVNWRVNNLSLCYFRWFHGLLFLFVVIERKCFARSYDDFAAFRRTARAWTLRLTRCRRTWPTRRRTAWTATTFRASLVLLASDRGSFDLVELLIFYFMICFWVGLLSVVVRFALTWWPLRRYWLLLIDARLPFNATIPKCSSVWL